MMQKKIVLPTLFLALALIALFLFRSPKKITFADHISPLLTKHCINCHRPNGPAPFALTSFQLAKEKAKLMAYVTSIRFMPPWPADPSYTHFTDENVLSENEIKLFSEWIVGGLLPGDTASLIIPKYFNDSSMLGKPDMVIKMKEPYHIPGSNTDNFLVMKLPYEMQHDTFIRAIEFVPDKQNLVHHMNGFLMHYEEGKKKNVFEGDWFENTEQMSYPDAYSKMKIAHDDGTFPTLTPSVCNYLPGVLPTLYPEGIGGFMMKKKGAVFIKDMHYGPRTKDFYDNSYFNIFFAPAPPTRRTMELQLGTYGISKIEPPLVIPADSVKTFLTRFRIPVTMSVLTVNPHMHLLGKKFLAFAINPSGDTIPLIRINAWDFKWQYFYTFKKPVVLPAGSEIFVYGTYDNTRSNPHNPFDPPRTVSEREGSMRTSDEMFQFIITYLPYRKNDEKLDLEAVQIKK